MGLTVSSDRLEQSQIFRMHLRAGGEPLALFLSISAAEAFLPLAALLSRIATAQNPAQRSGSGDMTSQLLHNLN